jgi:hypothetical protein
MARLRARKQILEAVSMHMLEAGKLMTAGEWKVDSTAPISYGQLQNHFSSWGRLTGCIKRDHPDAWEELHRQPEPEPELTPPPAPLPKEDPLEALSQAAEKAESEKEDE